MQWFLCLFTFLDGKEHEKRVVSDIFAFRQNPCFALMYFIYLQDKIVLPLVKSGKGL